MCERSREWDGDVEERGNIQRPTEQSFEWLAPMVLEHKHLAHITPEELDRPRCPIGVELGTERVFMLQSLERFQLWIVSRGRNHEDWGKTVTKAPGQCERAFPQRRELVRREFRQAEPPYEREHARQPLA
jgi:hypothetical protein